INSYFLIEIFNHSLGLNLGFHWRISNDIFTRKLILQSHNLDCLFGSLIVCLLWNWQFKSTTDKFWLDISWHFNNQIIAEIVIDLYRHRTMIFFIRLYDPSTFISLTQ